MTFEWNPIGLVGILAIVVGWTAAVIVYRAAPRRLSNRTLALILVLESTGVGIARGVLYFFADDTLWVNGFSGVVTSMWVIITVAYLIFLSTLDTPIVRFLRPWPVRIALIVAGLVWWGIVLLGPVPIWPRIYITNFEIFTWIGVYGLIVAVSAWYFAHKGPQRRRQALAYAAAFGWRDAMWFLYLHVILPVWGDVESINETSAVFAFIAPSITIVFILLLAYGILSTQLFDIHLKIKWTIKRSTLIAIFAGMYFITAQAAQAFLTTTYHWAIGGVIAGFLLLLIGPLQRFAGRMADMAMPGVQDTPEYRDARKAVVYEATLEELLADGSISPKERKTLFRLQRELDLEASRANALEEKVMERMGVA